MDELYTMDELRATCGIVLFRVPMSSPAAAVGGIVDVLNSRQDWTGMFAVVEDRRIRFRPLPAGAEAGELA